MALSKSCKRILVGVVTYLVASGILGLIMFLVSKGRQAKELCAQPEAGVVLSTFCAWSQDPTTPTEEWVPPAFEKPAYLRQNAPGAKEKDEDLPTEASQVDLTRPANDEPQTPEPATLKDLFNQAGAVNYFKRKLTPSKRATKKLDGFSICPQGGDAFYQCAHVLTSRAFYSTFECSDLTQPKKALICCPHEYDFLVSNCPLIVKNPRVMQDYLNSGKLWENYFLSQGTRDAIQGELLSALVRLPGPQTFSLFLLDFSKDEVGEGEYRRFLPDGTLVCYQYEKASLGRAKIKKCPRQYQGIVLDLSDLNYYERLDNATLLLSLPSWKEYCSYKKC